jgi:hypothetical protein
VLSSLLDISALEIEGTVTELGNKWRIPMTLELFAPMMQMQSTLQELRERVDICNAVIPASSDRTASTPQPSSEYTEQDDSRDMDLSVNPIAEVPDSDPGKRSGSPDCCWVMHSKEVAI